MRFVSLQSKDVINVYDGKKIGYIADIELDWCQKCIRALIVEKMNFFHFFCFFKDIGFCKDRKKDTRGFFPRHFFD